MNIKEKILQHKPKTQTVEAFGDTLHVRVMSGKERDSFEASIVGDNGKTNLENIRARLVARCLCDADGKRVFEDSEVEQLGDVACDELDKVFSVAQKVNGISKGDVDELAKN